MTYDLSKLKVLDNEAWSDCFTSFYAVAFHAVNRLIKDSPLFVSSELEDIACEAVELLGKKIDVIRDEMQVNAFLRTTAKNLVMTALEKKNAKKRSEGMRELLSAKKSKEDDDGAAECNDGFDEIVDTTCGNPEKLASRSEAIIFLHKGLSQLPEHMRRMIVMEANGHTQAEIGAALGFDTSSVGKRLKDAKQKLKNLLLIIPGSLEYFT